MNRLARGAVSAGLEQRLLLTNYTLLHYETHNNISFRDPGYTATISPPETGNFVHLGQPVHGEVIDLGGGTFTYIPDDDYAGPDHFIAEFHNYIDYGEFCGITDNMYYLGIDLNVYLAPPQSEDDSTYDWEDPEKNTVYTGVNYFVLEGNSLSIEKEDGVLKNDNDWRYEEAWDVLSAVIKTGQIPGAAPGFDYDADYGDVGLAPDGSFTYTPYQSVFDDPSFAGIEDTFYYVAVDQFGVAGNVAKVTVDLAKVVITRNGVDVDTDPTQLDVWVGEKIAPQATILGNVGLPLKYQWSVDSKAIDNYVSTEEFAVVIPLDADELKTASPSFYWVNGGSKATLVTVTVAGQTEAAAANFMVKRPNRQVTSVTAPGLSLRQSGNKVHVYYGGIDANGNRQIDDPGIRFIRTTDPNALAPDVGEYRWTQIVTTYIRAEIGSVVVQQTETGLDNRIS